VLAHAHQPAGWRTTDGPRLEVADIVRAHGPAFARAHALTPDQHAVLRDIGRCRTAALGGHANVCDDCGHVEVSYNSCRNRHCPKCQSLAQARWLNARLERILPTHYFHVVFTLPSELHAVAMANRELVFDLLLSCSAEALLELGRNPRWLGAEFGISSVLHTWNRELLWHPHAHCIVTGGGLSLDGHSWIATRSDFLLPVRVLGALFRGKFLDRLVRAYEAGELRLNGPAAPVADPRRFARLRDKLYRTRWHVYVKPPFGGPKQVFAYVGRYTHRVGLSNHRLVAMDERGVTFRTRGQNTITVAPDEFLSRFLLHVLPRRFVKIRHYGLMAPGNVNTKLATARQLMDSSLPLPANNTVPLPTDFRELMLALTGIDIRCCPVCGGSMTRHPLSILTLASPVVSIPPQDTS
jgi:hypothetical protein